MISLLRILVGFTVILAVLALPFAVAVLVASGHKVMEDEAWLRAAGLGVLALFPVAALVLAWRAWRLRAQANLRPAFLVLGGVPAWAALGAGLLVTAQVMAPAASPIPRPPEDLRALGAFLAAPDAPLVLDLRGRRLRAIPASVLEGRGLHELDLRDNQLTTLPDALLSMPALRMIRIGGNPIPPEEVRRFSFLLLANSSRMVISD
jgi:hypothetical protein